MHRQERLIHDKAKPKTYTTLATGALMRLRKRLICKSENDIGIDGEWVPRIEPVKIPVPMDQLLTMCMTLEDLVAHKYPLWPEEVIQVEAQIALYKEAETMPSIQPEDPATSSLPETRQNLDDEEEEPEVNINHNEIQELPIDEADIDATSSTNRSKDLKTCARCHNPFEIKYPLESFEMEICNYHYGALRSVKIDGISQLQSEITNCE